MSLKTNPFHILHLACSASRRDIMRASDELSFSLDSQVCAEAVNTLINTNKRLQAEMEWFIDANASQLEVIRNYIDSGLLIGNYDLCSLSKFNIALYNFEQQRGTNRFDYDYAIIELDELYSAISIPEITGIINRNHRLASISVVNEQEVEALLEKRRDDIRHIITDKLSLLNQDSFVKLVTSIATKCVADPDYNDGVILSDLIDIYEVRMQSVIESETDSIEGIIDAIKQKCSTMMSRTGSSYSAPFFSTEMYKDQVREVSVLIDNLIKSVKKWDTLAQPLQLKSQASGVPHEISEKLGYSLRNLTLFLHNEKGLTQQAHTISYEMRGVFAEIGELSELFSGDSEKLRVQKIADDFIERFKQFDKSWAVITNVLTPPSLATINRFLDDTRKLNAQIQVAQIDPETKAFLREQLCYHAREIAIKQDNTFHQTPTTITITQELNGMFGDLPALRQKLLSDMATLQSRRSSSSQAYRYPTATNRSNNGSTKSNNVGCGVIALILVGLFIIIMIIGEASDRNKYSSSTSKSSSSYSQSVKTTSKPTTKSTAKQATTAPAKTYTVTLSSDGGIGGTSKVNVKKGSSMPTASKPSKAGYEFLGYYSSKNGGGTKYYDSNMKSVHTWDKSENGTLYAYWKATTESKYTSSSSTGSAVYVDITSIFPEIGIYSSTSMTYSAFVCKCSTASGTAWVHISASDYKKYFDSTVSTSVLISEAETKYFSKAKRVHGTVVTADSIMSGLASDTARIIIEFKSVG